MDGVDSERLKSETVLISSYSAVAKTLVSTRFFFDSVLPAARKASSVKLMPKDLRKVLPSRTAQIPNIKRNYGGDYMSGHALEHFAYRNPFEWGHS
jgi:hypothetical protein